MGQSISHWRRRRGASTLLELAPKKTPGHDEPLPNLNRDTLLNALGNVAAYINRRADDITVVAVGGAVNTIYLQSRATTHDVDFFNAYLTTNEFELIVKGAKDALSRDSILEEQWFNNRTILFIPRDQLDALTQEAFRQNEVVFQQPGLRVLAAPWDYAFCCKIDRLSGGGLHNARPYDFTDATEYLRRYCVRNGRHQVAVSEVRAWFRRYSLRWSAENDNAIAMINAKYARQFGINYPIIC